MSNALFTLVEPVKIVIGPKINKVTDSIGIAFAEIEGLWYYTPFLEPYNITVSKQSSPGFKTKKDCKLQAWENLISIIETSHEDEESGRDLIIKIKRIIYTHLK